VNLNDDLNRAIDIARAAAAVVMQYYGNVKRLTKRHNEAVSDADRASQRLIVSELRKLFPQDGIIGEENETGDAITFDVPNPAGRTWVIDPIDGTNNFLAGLSNFAVCIGLLDAGRPVLGVVQDVTRGQTYSAAAGIGATLDGRHLHVAQTPMDDTAMLMLTSNLLDAQGHCPNFPMRLLEQTNWKIRMMGSAALEAVQVAAGVAHGAITINGKLWDIAAPAAIVLEAGGIVTDPRGGEIFPFRLAGYAGAKVPFVAAAPAAHAQLIREINCQTS
jgi:myo-inositol-1(or 4)-monophosphatase